MIVTHENYHSTKTNKAYLSVSQYKNFAGSLGLFACEAKALAKITGEWIEESTPAMMMSSYVDAHFANTLNIFRAKHSKIYKKNGEIKAAFKRAEEIINRIERDEYFMRYMSGKKQVIMTAELFGTKWKIMVDSYIPGRAVVDLKVMMSLRKSHFVRDYGFMSFMEFYGYELQGAIYQKVVELNTGKRLPFFVAGASKEAEPDIEIIGIDDNRISELLDEVAGNIPRILKLKSGKLKPDRCGRCDYCRATKILTKPIHYTELITKI